MKCPLRPSSWAQPYMVHQIWEKTHLGGRQWKRAVFLPHAAALSFHTVTLICFNVTCFNMSCFHTNISCHNHHDFT